MDIVVAITLFVLALLIGVEVIGKVPATLHTPLMSGANSIHGIVIAGVTDRMLEMFKSDKGKKKEEEAK